MNRTLKFVIILMLPLTFVFGQEQSSSAYSKSNSTDKTTYKHSLGASFFMLGNFLEESPDYYLLTYGYRFTKKDRFFVEFNTWKYSEPLGTYGKSEEFYPGYVRALGVGIGYQRFHWKWGFTTIEATSFMKQYHDVSDNKIQKGFQLYLQLVAGYRFNFFKDRFYIEPAYAFKYWPIDTNYPEGFSKIEKGTPKFIFEPSLNFGFKF